ncbi:MAG: PIN domain-containing protein [Gammaproteobacteria bacterium]
MEALSNVVVFVGESQEKFPVDLATAMQGLHENAKYVKISGNGPNALDFHVAFYIGQLASSDPADYDHMISNYTGFDPLIKHLQGRKIRVR